MFFSLILLINITNLISNAIKFTKEDGQIKVHLEKLDKTVLITVSDNEIKGAVTGNCAFHLTTDRTFTLKRS
jgi:K+-sensing histidine kinase KdpD